MSIELGDTIYYMRKDKVESGKVFAIETVESEYEGAGSFSPGRDRMYGHDPATFNYNPGKRYCTNGGFVVVDKAAFRSPQELFDHISKEAQLTWKIENQDLPQPSSGTT